MPHVLEHPFTTIVRCGFSKGTMQWTSFDVVKANLLLASLDRDSSSVRLFGPRTGIAVIVPDRASSQSRPTGRRDP